MKILPGLSERAWLVLACLLLAAALLLMLSSAVQAGESADRYRIGDAVVARSVGGTYRLDTYTIDNGGGISSDARYRLQGSAGQSDAQPAAADARYRLQGGFWPEGGAVGSGIFNSSFENP
jgi:hypothetical protein